LVGSRFLLTAPHIKEQCDFKPQVTKIEIEGREDDVKNKLVLKNCSHRTLGSLLPRKKCQYMSAGFIRTVL
jgi:hypothetical protein